MAKMHALSRRELYQFDCTGLLKIPGLIDKGTIEICHREILAGPSRTMSGRGDKIRFDSLTERNRIFVEIAQHPTLLRCIEPLINQPLRLVESYAMLRGPNSIFFLHNGNSEHVVYGDNCRVKKNMGLSHTYHDGKLHCMLVKAVIYCDNIESDGDGPFCYLEGSHKANFSYFEDSIDNVEKPELTVENFPTLRHVYAQSGDVLIINEALLHGTLPKSTPDNRLIMAFTYAPCFVSDWTAVDLVSASINKLGHY